MNVVNRDGRCAILLNQVLFLVAASFFLLIIEANAQTGGPPGYTFCANENQTCSFAGTASVAYGANGTFFYKILANSTPCNNAVFGDPLFGTIKACYYQIIPPTSIQFGTSSTSPVENSDSAAITVTRSGSSTGAVSVTYSLQNSNATGGPSCTAGVDYINTGGTVSFADGDAAEKTINVILCNDTVYENDEYFSIYLHNPAGGAVVGSNSKLYIQIRDDESLLQLSSSAYYGSDASASVTITVFRGGSVGAVSASYSFADGTAVGGTSCTPGVDYLIAGGTVTFADGDDAPKSISVALCNDAALEGIESLSVALSDSTGNVTLGPPSTAAVIIRDPGAASFTVNELGDAGDGVCDATCTFRDALETANGDSESDDTINFEPEIFSEPQSIYLTNWLSITDEVKINGVGSDRLSISGDNKWGVFAIATGVTATLDGLTIRDGWYYYNASGISNLGTLTVSDSVITGNQSVDSAGGGVYNGGTLTIINSTVSANHAYAWDWGSIGGGVSNDGTVTIIGSTISENSTDWGSAGGIYNSGTLNVNNSTISGNRTYSAGGIYNYAGTLNINNSTISGNTAYDVAGIYSDSPNETIRNTIVAGNTDDGSPSDIFGTIGTARHNLIGHAGSSGGIQNGVNGNIVGVNPLLGPLQNNGGPTKTHAILQGSAARNAGDNCLLTENGCGSTHPALLNDQRGMPRNGPVDIGAFERQTNEPSTKTLFDFDGDGRADVSVYREGEWYVNGSQTGFMATNWGNAADRLAAADYDGDGKTDTAIYRGGEWWILNSDGSGYAVVNWGNATDVPVPADYDGDGRADYAVYREGTWWIYQTTAGVTGIQWGNATDIPMPADYDGDGKTDVAIVRDGTWWILQSTLGATGIQWGNSTDKPVPADYDGDGKTDVAIVRDGTWWIFQSTLGVTGISWGNGTDIPVPADYDGDGKADVAIVRDGTWWILQSTLGATGVQWGAASDIPVPRR